MRTGTGMHYGSGSGLGTRFGSGSNIKGNKNIKRILKKICAFFCFWKTAKYCLDPGPELEPELEPEPEPETEPEPVPEPVQGTGAGTGTRTKTFQKSESDTAAATNRYGSTTLPS